MPFSRVVGQDNSIAILRRALVSGRLAHAYLFEGIEGCGKKATALALIEAVFCGREDGCGTCPSCRKMASMQHPDLHLIEPDGAFIKIDQIRELQKSLAYRPFEAPKKACIIDGADRLNQSSGNALLKTLEEPPGNAIIILITAQSSAVLPTILSRCQRLQFQVLPERAIADHLTAGGIDAESASIAASLSGGSMVKAMEISNEATLSGRKELLERLSNLSLAKISPLFATAEELAADKEKALELLELLTSFLRDILLLKAGVEDVVNADMRPLLVREAASQTQSSVLRQIEHIADARHALLRNVNARLTLEVLFMRLAEPLVIFHPHLQ